MTGFVSNRAHYSPPWANVSIIGIAGSSGSGKSTLSHAIVSKLSLPWVVILSMDSFYKTLDEESSRKAFRNEYDFDSPDAIDFDVLVDRLRDLKAGRRAEIPIYSFAKHAREKETTSIYSPHVLILEVLRDVAERGRDIEGCIKQWFLYVKPNFEQYVEPQRKVADIIVPRGVENRVAMKMVIMYIERRLIEKSKAHRDELKKLGQNSEDEVMSKRVILLAQTPQLRGMNTIIQDIDTSAEDFIFYFDRLSTLLIENAMNNVYFKAKTIETPAGNKYSGLQATGETSAVIILRAGAAFENGLKRVLPDCRTGRLLIQSNVRNGEPELHYLKLPEHIETHDSVLLLDPQMSSGGAALMAVQVLLDHGVPEEKIVFVTYLAGRMGLMRLTKVFPEVKVIVSSIVPDYEERPRTRRAFSEENRGEANVNNIRVLNRSFILEARVDELSSVTLHSKPLVLSLLISIFSTLYRTFTIFLLDFVNLQKPTLAIAVFASGCAANANVGSTPSATSTAFDSANILRRDAPQPPNHGDHLAPLSSQSLGGRESSHQKRSEAALHPIHNSLHCPSRVWTWLDGLHESMRKEPIGNVVKGISKLSMPKDVLAWFKSLPPIHHAKNLGFVHDHCIHHSFQPTVAGACPSSVRSWIHGLPPSTRDTSIGSIIDGVPDISVPDDAWQFISGLPKEDHHRSLGSLLGSPIDSTQLSSTPSKLVSSVAATSPAISTSRVGVASSIVSSVISKVTSQNSEISSSSSGGAASDISTNSIQTSLPKITTEIPSSFTVSVIESTSTDGSKSTQAPSTESQSASITKSLSATPSATVKSIMFIDASGSPTSLPAPLSTSKVLSFVSSLLGLSTDLPAPSSVNPGIFSSTQVSSSTQVASSTQVTSSSVALSSSASLSQSERFPGFSSIVSSLKSQSSLKFVPTELPTSSSSSLKAVRTKLPARVSSIVSSLKAVPTKLPTSSSSSLKAVQTKLPTRISSIISSLKSAEITRTSSQLSSLTWSLSSTSTHVSALPSEISTASRIPTIKPSPALSETPPLVTSLASIKSSIASGLSSTSVSIGPSTELPSSEPYCIPQTQTNLPSGSTTSGFASSKGSICKFSHPQATGPPRSTNEHKPPRPGSGKPHDPQDSHRGDSYRAPEVAGGFNFHNGNFFDPAAPKGPGKTGQARDINSAIPRQIQKALSDDRIDFYDPGHGAFYYVNKCNGGKGCIVIEVARSCDCYVSARDQELHILSFDPKDETIPSVYNQDTKLPVAVVWFPAPGDSFEKIAEYFATDLATLIAANPLITYPTKLDIGQPINVPAQTHTVERGETMVTIANMYNVPLKTIEDLNRAIKHPKDIHPGQLLKVPTHDAAEPFAYLTQPGDTFEKIAAQYRQTVPAIIAANPQIADPDVLYSGQVINIPVYMPSQGKLDFNDTCPKQEAEAKKRDGTLTGARFARAAPARVSTTTTTIDIGPTNAPIVANVLV
ncbi:uridine kinase [Drepanopeziza brunnea f. sp. 'multigermtubi' MB_m1]|uniref:uridine/cytidine kinase n=1 Tax=Marssonina brunnea f. sp. multigermtubi (strain MB_m1) TaxID=1072389 RepID=K1WVH8_MARBU|nr:uridine kinase [Drepanopeziza brunnea f. sp. 'multigermtubi' MB_m1]EKD21625.1 uridine kinase [Drepanopeziza brunnea f. sp. 'multigermtubi' MB_m1]